MKKNALVFFFKSLLKSVLVIVSILAVGIISYKVSYEVLSRQLEEGKIEASQKELDIIIDKAKTDEISKNLIYVVDDKQQITHMMLEICNTNTCNMDYVTIPVKTDYTIPTKMYQKLCVVDEEIPQIIRLSKLRKYFINQDDEKAYGYAELIMERLLGTDISYFTVLSEEIYDSHYEEKRMTTSYKNKSIGSLADSAENTSAPMETASSTPVGSYSSSVTMKVSVASDIYLNQLSALSGDREKMKEYIMSQYAQESKLISNLTVYNKLGYLEAYEKMNEEFYHYWGIPGSFSGNSFTIDEASATAFLKKLEKNETAYTEAQAFGRVSRKKAISSKGKKILILNGSKISGLAGSKQQELVGAGYTVPKIGDYTEEVLTQTRIIVTKDGMGQDIASYFKEPEIVVGDVTQGYDIEVILGTIDAN